MKKNAVLAASLLVASACAQDNPPPQGWEGLPSGETGGGTDVNPIDDDDDAGTTGGNDGGDETGDPSGDPTVGDDSDSDDPTGDDPTGEEPVDCTPGWETPWIGSPCASDGDCSFSGGSCLLPEDGFPCGTCTQSCTTTCPDEDGTPVTYCINGVDVDLSNAGYCLSKCDSAFFPESGCRDGYTCEVLTRFDETGNSGVCIPEAFDAIDPPDDELVDEIDHEFLIQHFGGDPVNAWDYPATLEGFQMYLNDVGVQFVTAEELALPYNQSAATGCGYDILLPERDQWEKGAALAIFTDQLEDLVGEPIFVRNWWRPPCYNDAVGGAAGGDHPPADALDLDFSSSTSRAIAQQWLCENYWSQDIVTPDQIAPGADVDPRLNMSIGLGGVTIHLGVLSDGGRRNWFYGSYTNEPNSGNCW
ncbi:MAG: D-Ala-D-Ala carboxypeptidase family metallohydrolase [Myxococcota bacterium]